MSDAATSAPGCPPGAYVLHAPDEAAGRAFIEAAGAPDSERLTFHGDEVQAVPVLELLYTPPLSGLTRVVAVRRAEAVPRKEMEALLQAVAAHPVRRDWLVLWDRSPEGRVMALLRELAPSGHPFTVVEPEPKEAARWAGGVAEELGKSLRLTPAARALVTAALRRFPERAEQELLKLASYGAPELGEREVRLLLSADLLEAADDTAASRADGTDDRRRFEVASAALEGDFARALWTARALQHEGLPAAWFWRDLSRQAMQLWDVAEALEARFGAPEHWPVGAEKSLPETVVAGRPAPVVRQWARQARRWGTAGLLQILLWAAEADHHAKRGGMNPPDALTRLFARMADLAGRAT
ncbi:MAG: hypothetical protein AB1609_21070 [Bacillota bacterium]